MKNLALKPEIIYLPKIIEEKNKLSMSLSDKKIEELLIWEYDYGKNTAIPILEFFPETFGEILKELVFEEAIKKVKLDDEAILKKKYSTKKTFGDITYTISVFPSQKPAYEKIIRKTEDFLETIIEDNKKSNIRKNVRKEKEGPYVFTDYLKNTMKTLLEKNTTRFNNKTLPLGKNSLDKNIEKMSVFFDKERYSQLNTFNSETYFKSRSLKSKIKEFLKEFEKSKILSYEDINKENVFIPLNMSNGFTVLYALSSTTSPPHKDIYTALIGKDTDKISKTNGDLDIIEETAFKPDYEFKNNVKIINETMTNSKTNIKITRFYDNKELIKTYSVHKYGDKLFVLVDDILDKIKDVRNIKTEKIETKLDIDFFSPFPNKIIKQFYN